MRRGAVLSALLLTALMLSAWPGLLRGLWEADENRMAESLRPARRRTLTLWSTTGGMQDQRLLARVCAMLEKQRPGLRVFLRKAEPEELRAGGAVLPDAVWFGLGEIPEPEKWFLPLEAPESIPEETLSSGKSGGFLYALPLWREENVLSVPSAWLQEGTADAAPREGSLLGRTAPAPAPAKTEARAPWTRLMEEGVWIQAGVCGPQFAFSAPATLRQKAALAAGNPSGKEGARVWSLRAHQAATAAGEAWTAFPLEPRTSDRIRYLALCREGEDARALVALLLGRELDPLLEEQGLLSLSSGEKTFLPNAFAHTREELEQLCREGLRLGKDPAAILLGLR